MNEGGVDVITPIEGILLQIPGAATPLGRVAVFGGAGAAFAYWVRPSVSFDESGQPKPWIVTDSKNPNATLFPYWAWFVVPATLFGVLI